MQGHERNDENDREYGTDSEGTQLRDFSSRYQRPNVENNLWTFPLSSIVLADFKRCGGVVRTFLYAVLGDTFDIAEATIFLGQLLTHLKGSEDDYEQFENLRKTGEEAQLLMVEDTAMRMALRGDDTQSMKFLLERRRANRFGRAAEDAGDEIAEELKRVRNKMRNK